MSEDDLQKTTLTGKVEKKDLGRIDVGEGNTVNEEK